ncbi:MAG TPA: hypothetical protein VKA38_01980, partial [Draconibacterium sp.]|nr:hypothetical protein [Draconibacterium sp.]
MSLTANPTANPQLIHQIFPHRSDSGGKHLPEFRHRVKQGTLVYFKLSKIPGISPCFFSTFKYCIPDSV